ncbi:CBO0543 family protein [Tumebacillus permanentifrigoris]|uniref:Uncharacterized protein n=1 Tax=Tumebacillus permanentifrigoris TaxID=378543 RepID=A0A316D5V0_9BACL|nr:CBO0543 family protein [Tumebacillus permanentifrigoris]PWK09041.1 hypothetical protein C7459_114108 [Tumebacillus permanentifrigoris]
MTESYPLFDEIVQTRRNLRDLEIQHWYQVELFSFNWWLILILTIVFWGIWFKFIDRRRLLEITFFGAMIVISSTVLDMIGVDLVLWAYPSRLEPLAPSLIPGDLVMMPVSYMFVYQYFDKRTGPFLIVSTLVAAVLAFGVEPVLEWLDIYETYGWEYLYSFPIYVILAWCMRNFVHKLLRHQQPPPR